MVFDQGHINFTLFSLESQLKMKCGACGKKGHMKTNRECPYFTPESNGQFVGIVCVLLFK